jgi:hypothetical protein
MFNGRIKIENDFTWDGINFTKDYEHRVDWRETEQDYLIVNVMGISRVVPRDVMRHLWRDGLIKVIQTDDKKT